MDLVLRLKDRFRQSATNVAVDGNQTLSYGDLFGLADSLCAKLLESGVVAGENVAIETRDPCRGLIALLACYLAEATPVLIGVGIPNSQLTSMLAVTDCAARIDNDHVVHESPREHQRAKNRKDIGYIVFTSGSTGLPKAVAVSQSAFSSRLEALRILPGMGKQDRMLALTPINFDISLAELILPLTVGATILAGEDAWRRNPTACADFLAEYSPTIIQGTPSFWRLMIAGKWSGNVRNKIWCGGEVLSSSLASELLAGNGELWNLYGPSEATIWATAGRVTDPRLITLGDTLKDTTIGIVDSDGAEIEETDLVGEVWIGGGGLAEGYVKNREATKVAFVTGRCGDRRYLTGDYGSWTSDKRVLFHGRRDGQVKLRGHRIELGHIEAVLDACPGLYEVAVIMNEGSNVGNQLVAFWSGQDADEGLLRSWAKSRLTSVMRPTKYKRVDTLPKSRSGKVDRAALQRLC
jgi:D-alanine--poly(phosphoribitol) ligase subunit 1